MVKPSKCLDIMSVAVPLTTQTIDMKWKNLVKGQKKEKQRCSCLQCHWRLYVHHAVNVITKKFHQRRSYYLKEVQKGSN